MKRFKNILYVFEKSITQDTVIARAVSLAQNNQARLTVVDVVAEQTAGIRMPPGGPIAKDITAAMVEKRREMLESLIAPYKGLLDISVEVFVGIKFLEVIRAVLQNDHDLVIKPAENPSWIERLFGSDDMHLLRKTPCPVWLMKEKEKSNYERILAAVDFNPDETESNEQALNQQILGLASSLALSDFAQLHLAHVWDAPDAGFVSVWADNSEVSEMNIIKAVRAQHKAGMDRLTQTLSEQIGAETYKYLTPQVHLPMGSGKKEIPALVKELKIDLVVMGTVSRTGIPGFIIGNTAETILDQLQCSVLVIKPPGFVSPVPKES
jgi:nucleotide-binding universal stress UspA family protein